MGLDQGVPGAQKSGCKILGKKEWSRFGPIRRQRTYLSWSWGTWERKTQSLKYRTKHGKYAGGFRDAFLKRRSPEVAFSSSHFLFLFQIYQLSNLSSSFYLLLTIHLMWDAYETQKQKASCQEGLTKISSLPAPIACWVQKTQCRQRPEDESGEASRESVRRWPQPLIINHGQLELKGSSESPCSTPSFHR